MDDFSRYVEQQLENPEFKEEWDSSKPEYELMRLLVLARSKNKMTQAELARKTGIRQSNISRIENGSQKFSKAKLEKLSDLFQIDIQTIKDLFFADKFATEAFKYKCSDSIFSVVEKATTYIKNKQTVQGKLEL